MVDDEPDLLRVLERYLTREKFEVLTAATIETALKLLDAWSIAAVVVDLHLGASDGFGLVHAVRAWHRGVYCVVLTGYGCDEAAALGIPCVRKGDRGSMAELTSRLRAALGL